MMVAMTLAIVVQCIVLFGITVNVYAFYMASTIELDTVRTKISDVVIALFRTNIIWLEHCRLFAYPIAWTLL